MPSRREVRARVMVALALALTLPGCSADTRTPTTPVGNQTTTTIAPTTTTTTTLLPSPAATPTPPTFRDETAIEITLAMVDEKEGKLPFPQTQKNFGCQVVSISGRGETARANTTWRITNNCSAAATVRVDHRGLNPITQCSQLTELMTGKAFTVQSDPPGSSKHQARGSCRMVSQGCVQFIVEVNLATQVSPGECSNTSHQIEIDPY